jgi:hypothetical protein
MVLKLFLPCYVAIFLIRGNAVLNSLRINPKIYRIGSWVLLLAAIFILLKLAPALTRPDVLPSDDFTHTWASEKLLINGENPYDAMRIEQLKSTSGVPTSTLNTPSITLNPPWLITLMLPFGLLDYPASRLLWLISSTIIILVSAVLLWGIYSNHPKQRWMALLAAFIFAPTISVLEKGQVTTLLLIGIVGFLYFTVKNPNDWLAGVFLAIASVKPQVILLFWVVLVFWVIRRRRWITLISAFISVFVLMSISFLINPHILSQYLGMLEAYPLSDWANPTIGSYIRFFWLGVDRYWPQFLPALIAVLWFMYYWYRHQATWDWIYAMPVILLVSMLSSPYSWTYDLVILIPCIIAVTSWIAMDWKRWSTLLLAGIFLAMTILDLYLHTMLDDFWFIWMAPSMLIWYLLARWQYPPFSSQTHRIAKIHE